MVGHVYQVGAGVVGAALGYHLDAIRLLNEAMPNDKVLALRSLEALAKVANGKATKIIIPSDLQNLEMCIRDRC